MFAGSAAYRPIILAFFLVLFATVTLGASTAIAASCESLAHLSLSNTQITSAADVAAGAFTPPLPGRANAAAQPSWLALRSSAGVLPRNGHLDALERFRYQDRSVAAGVRME